MAADHSELESLHALIAMVMREEIEYYRENKIPVPAADKAVIVKFLKDNAVVSTPKSSEELDALRAEFTSTKRGDRLAKLREAIGADLDSTDNIISFGR